MNKLKFNIIIGLLVLLPTIAISQKTIQENQKIIMMLNPAYEIYKGNDGYLKVITAPGKSIYEFSYKLEKGEFIRCLSDHTDDVNFELQKIQEKNKQVLLLKLVYKNLEEIIEFKQTTKTNYDN